MLIKDSRKCVSCNSLKWWIQFIFFLKRKQRAVQVWKHIQPHRSYFFFSISKNIINSLYAIHDWTPAMRERFMWEKNITHRLHTLILLYARFLSQWWFSFLHLLYIKICNLVSMETFILNIFFNSQFSIKLSSSRVCK